MREQDVGAQAAHFLESSLREKIIEHIFLGELLRHLWIRGARGIAVLRAEVDSGGYDLVLECNGVERHVQLKTSHESAKTRHVAVNTSLAGRANSCVIWIIFDPHTLKLGPYLWLGGLPHEPLKESDLGSRRGRQARANSQGIKRERPNVRVISKKKFRRLAVVSDVAEALFGEFKHAEAQ